MFPAARSIAGAAQNGKYLSSGQVKAIFKSHGTLLGEFRVSSSDGVIQMHAKFYLPIVGVLAATIAMAQTPQFLEGSEVVASPLMLPDKWEKCTVEQYLEASDGYQLSCGPVKYVVPSRYVLEATEQNLALTIPEEARDLMPSGTEVVASPTYLPDRWERCFVVRPLYETNGYEISCNSVLYVVSRTQVLPATEENIALKSVGDIQTSVAPDPQSPVDAQPTAENNWNEATPAPVAGFFPGMMIDASPMDGVWGAAIVIEQVDDGFRVQMLPGLSEVGTPQLILRTDQMREPMSAPAPMSTVEQATAPQVDADETLTEQQFQEPNPETEATLTSLTLPNGVYSCGKSTGGMVFFMGEIELLDGSYRGPAYDGQFGEWYPMAITAEGTITWGGPLVGFEGDSSKVVSTAIKSDGGKPAFDVLLQLASGNFMSISCVPKY